MLPAPSGKLTRRTARFALLVLVLAQVALAFQTCLLPRSALAAVAAAAQGAALLSGSGQGHDARCNLGSPGVTPNACLAALAQGDQSPLSPLIFAAPAQPGPPAPVAFVPAPQTGPVCVRALPAPGGHPPIPIAICRLLN
jgi:hypothetical protein